MNAFFGASPEEHAFIFSTNFLKTHIHAYASPHVHMRSTYALSSLLCLTDSAIYISCHRRIHSHHYVESPLTFPVLFSHFPMYLCQNYISLGDFFTVHILAPKKLSNENGPENEMCMKTNSQTSTLPTLREAGEFYSHFISS